MPATEAAEEAEPAVLSLQQQQQQHGLDLAPAPPTGGRPDVRGAVVAAVSPASAAPSVVRFEARVSTERRRQQEFEAALEAALSRGVAELSEDDMESVAGADDSDEDEDEVALGAGSHGRPSKRQRRSDGGGGAIVAVDPLVSSPVRRGPAAVPRLPGAQHWKENDPAHAWLVSLQQARAAEEAVAAKLRGVAQEL